MAAEDPAEVPIKEMQQIMLSDHATMRTDNMVSSRSIDVPNANAISAQSSGHATLDAIDMLTVQDIVKTVNDFVIFLRDMFIPDEKILIPPPDGWPQITRESFAALGKDDAVIEVLRHLYYIEDSYSYKFEFETYMHNWLDRASEIAKGYIGLELFVTEIALEELGYEFQDDEERERQKYQICLTSGSRNAFNVIVDCTQNYIAQCGYSDQPHGSAGPLEEFTVKYMEEYRSMKRLIGVYCWPMVEEHDKEEEDRQVSKQVYVDHGWPDNYRKAECMAALKQKEAELREQERLAKSESPSMV